MSWLKEMFGKEKVIIGLLHLDELPGDPYYQDNTTMKDVIQHAREDLHALQEGGIDAILITNEWSIPYQRKVSQVNTNAIAMVVGALIDDIKVPYGVEAIYDGDATIELCVATDAMFTRCLFAGAWAGDFGLVDRNVSETIRLRYALHRNDLKLFYFINSEDEVYVNNRSLTDIAKSLDINCRPDGFVVAGGGQGRGPAYDQLTAVREVSDTPIMCGSGCKESTICDILDICDGAFVGTTLKKDGKARERIDVNRVRSFMNVVNQYRGL